MMDWLKTVAPLIGQALLGPLGGAAAAFVADKLGIESKTVEAVTDVLSSTKMTPEQIVAVKAAEIEFKKFLEEHKLDLDKLAAENTRDARDMQKTTRSAFPAVLSSGITLGFFGVLGWMLYDSSVVNSPPLLIMLGSLGAAFGAVVNFWLGSTAGSAQKTQLLAQAGAVKP